MSLESILEQVRNAHDSGTLLEICGGGSKRFLGRSVEGKALDVTSYSGVVDYDPSELVVTARCGTRIEELNRILDEQGQMLPFEPPQVTTAATVGGAVASGLSGPARPWSGSVRDCVLGVLCISGSAEVLRFGGRVMKNVAGYDASRLMVGAMGTLGIVMEVSFRVLPKPRFESTHVFEFDEARALEFAISTGLTPAPVSGCCFYNNRLYMRLSGTESGVRSAAQAIGGDLIEDSDIFWQGIRDLTHPLFLQQEQELWRISLPAATRPMNLEGHSLIDWAGAQRWISGNHDARKVWQAAIDAGGSASLFRYGDPSGELLPPLNPIVSRLHQNLKTGFDPKRILNRGRLYPDL